MAQIGATRGGIPAVLVLAAWVAAGAIAQPCSPGWDEVFDPAPAGAVLALHAQDGAPTPGLFVGGSFTGIAGADIARLVIYDGNIFALAGAGPDNTVHVISPTEADVLVAGRFGFIGDTPAPRVSRWTGSAWIPPAVGPNGDVLAAIDAGAAGAYYVAGSFNAAGGVSAAGVALHVGEAWSALGTGLQGGQRAGSALARLGGLLFVGGSFLGAGGIPSPNVAAWNGSGWAAAGAGLNGIVRAFEIFNGELIAGGDFTASGAQAIFHLARWTGAGWAPFAGGANGPVRTLRTITLRAGDVLVAGGAFTQIGGVAADRVAVYDGADWTALGAGSPAVVNAAAMFEDQLYIGSAATTPTGSQASALRRWRLCDAGVAGDINGDGVVNGTDLLLLLNQFGGPGNADLNGDGVVNGTDLLLLLNAFGT